MGEAVPRHSLSVSGGERALMPYGTLQGLKRSSTSTQAAERLGGIHGITSRAVALGSRPAEAPSHGAAKSRARATC